MKTSIKMPRPKSLESTSLVLQCSSAMAALILFSDFVGFPLELFKVFGLVPQGNPPMKRWKKGCLKICHVFFVMFTIENWGNLTLIAKNLPQNGYLLMAAVNTTYIYLKEKQFRKLLENLDEIFPKTKEEQNIFKVKKNLRNFKRFKRLVTSIIVIASSNIFVEKLVRFISTGVWYDGRMIVENWFPYDVNDPTLYNLTLLWTLSSGFFVTGGLLGSGLILCALVEVISMQFDILSMKLEKMKPNDSKTTLRELMQHHEKLLEMSKDLEAIFAPSILFNFVSSSIFLCLIAYQLSTRVNFEFTTLMIAALLQVMMFCTYGQKLTSAAENVATSVYNCDWSEDHKKMKTTLVMIIQRGQIRTKLTTMKFSDVNLAAFTVVSTH
jgi:hypothetical protein